MLQVILDGNLRAAAGDAESVQMEAASIGELLRRLAVRYPQMQKQLDEGVAVSINGNIYRDDWSQPIPADAEVFLLPRIAGG